MDDEVVLFDEFEDLGSYLEKEAPELSREGRRRQPLAEVKPLAPVLKPPKVVAVGLNYRDHAEEQNKTPPPYPMFFTKARTCIVGQGDPITLPSGRKYIDPEVEMAVVFARPGRDVPAAQALDYIFGFTIMNDVSDRKAQKDDRQYYRAKSFPSFGPCGPMVVTPDEFDHTEAAITLRLNGRVQQQSNISNLIFKVEKLVELLSQFQELEPGDLLTTGTPGGVGVFREPPVYLKDGDEVECEIEGLGLLKNPVRRPNGC